MRHTGQGLPYDSDEYPFQVLFLADKKDNVKILIQWPNDIPKPQVVKTMGHMLNHISCGNWSPPMIAATQKFGEESGQKEIASEILHTWSNQVTEKKNGSGMASSGGSVCVKPRHVFAFDRGRHE